LLRDGEGRHVFQLGWLGGVARPANERGPALGGGKKIEHVRRGYAAHNRWPVDLRCPMGGESFQEEKGAREGKGKGLESQTRKKKKRTRKEEVIFVTSEV